MNDIRKEDLIDMNENKAIDSVENTEVEEPAPEAPVVPETSETQNTREIPLKNISQLTNEERTYLINEAKKGIDNKFYKVSFCKNGSTKITKRRAPKQSMAEKFISKSNVNYVPQTPTMSNEQLLFEHVINLESQMATLRQKHKKLKKSYKQIYQDVYIDDEDQAIEQPAEPTNENTTVNEIPQTPIPVQRTLPRIRGAGWRQRLINNLY